MDLKLILKTFSNLRRMTCDEVAFLETLRAMNESECEALVETLSPQPVRKSSTKKSASKKSSRASSLEQQIQKRGQRTEAGSGDSTEDRCVYDFGPEDGPCGELADANIHHLRTHPYHHEFDAGKPAAPTASDSLSVNGRAGSSPANSETQKASAGSAAHEQSSNV